MIFLRCKILTGAQSFVQIQAIADVSQPFYRQYQELTKTYNRDCEMGSEDANGELNPTQAYSQRSANTFNNDANNKVGPHNVLKCETFL